MTAVLVGEMQRETHREEGQVRTQAETGAMLPRVQEHPEPPEAEEAETADSRFQALGSATGGELITTQFVVICYSSPREINRQTEEGWSQESDEHWGPWSPPSVPTTPHVSHLHPPHWLEP